MLTDGFRCDWNTPLLIDGGNRIHVTSPWRKIALVLFGSLVALGVLAPDAAAEDFEIRGRVQDQVTDDAGNSDRVPVEGVRIEVVDEAGAPVGEATTDAEGVAAIPVPARATYTVRLDESTLPDGLALDPRSPAEQTILVDDFVTNTKFVNYFTGQVQRNEVSYWEQLAQRLADGTRLGLIIAMCAVGLSLIFGTTGLTNFAHGEMVTFGALIAYLLHVTWGFPLLPMIPVAVVIGGIFGLGMDRVVFAPLRKRKIGLISQLVVSVGLSILLKNLFLYLFGGRTKQYTDFNGQLCKEIGPVCVTPRDLTTSAVSLVVLVLVALALQRTRLGKATRAVSDNPELASSTGIDSQRIIRVVWFLGGALAAMGGIFRGLDEGVSPFLGADLLFLMFAGITLGGLGSAFGALVGGFLVGLFVEVSTLGVPAFPENIPLLGWVNTGVPTELKNVPALLILVVILLVRPQGILGRRERVG
jgi:neutral amino acid transport system permease protein